MDYKRDTAVIENFEQWLTRALRQLEVQNGEVHLNLIERSLSLVYCAYTNGEEPPSVKKPAEELTEKYPVI